MKSNKYVIETVYKGYHFRSRLEARWAYFFDQIGVKYQYEVEGYELPGTRYLPDFLVTLHGYNKSWNIFIEIKPDYPFNEDQYKAQWLANYTRIPVYIFYNHISAPEPGEVHSIRFLPVEVSLKLLLYASSSSKEKFYPIYLPDNIYLKLLQFYWVGCQLTIETSSDREMKIGCLWKNETQHIPSSYTHISIEEIIKVLYLYDEMKDELKQVLKQKIASSVEPLDITIKNTLPLRFLLEFAVDSDNTKQGKWMHCASCKHVGIYPGDFSHDVDCLVNYVKNGMGGFIEPDDPDEENYLIRQNYYFNKSNMIQKAYVAAKSVRFEFGETP